MKIHLYRNTFRFFLMCYTRLARFTPINTSEVFLQLVGKSSENTCLSPQYVLLKYWEYASCKRKEKTLHKSRESTAYNLRLSNVPPNV